MSNRMRFEESRRESGRMRADKNENAPELPAGLAEAFFIGASKKIRSFSTPSLLSAPAQ
jgi:hypothetical protein